MGDDVNVYSHQATIGVATLAALTGILTDAPHNRLNSCGCPFLNPPPPAGVIPFGAHWPYAAYLIATRHLAPCPLEDRLEIHQVILDPADLATASDNGSPDAWRELS